jgi:D-alanine-D-alanine ligase
VVIPDGVAHFLEVDVAPGLTETSLLPMAITSDGAHLGTVFTALTDRAIARASTSP